MNCKIIETEIFKMSKTVKINVTKPLRKGNDLETELLLFDAFSPTFTLCKSSNSMH